MERELEGVHRFEREKAKKEGREPRKTKELLVQRLLDAALFGESGRDLKAIAVILDRVEGVRERKKTEADSMADMGSALTGVLDRILEIKKKARELPSAT